MKTAKVKISDIKTNPDNPRIIKDDKFKKLVQSLKDFPEMLELRPIVVNKAMVVLGGNMRLKAAEAAGMASVPITVADLTPEQEKEFIIKDNSSFGEWNWELLANEWDNEKLKEWGLDLPDFIEGNSKEDKESLNEKHSHHVLLAMPIERRKEIEKYLLPLKELEFIKIVESDSTMPPV